MKLVRNAGQHQWAEYDGSRVCALCGYSSYPATAYRCSGVKGILGRPVVEDLTGRGDAFASGSKDRTSALDGLNPPGPRPVKNRRAISPASPAQRAKVRELPCLVCGRDGHEATIDPMHLLPRGMLTEGQDDPLAVVPACRRCHVLYDREQLDASPFLEPRYREEVAFAVLRVGLFAALRRITNRRWTTEGAA